MKRYVIIGASIAGVSCVEGIRSVDPDGEITLVTAEAASNYGRPLISYYLEGKTDEARMSWRGSDFYEKNRVTVLHETRAVSIDAQGHTVRLDSGAALTYDALCICTGSAPVCPKFEGLEAPEFFRLRSGAARRGERGKSGRQDHTRAGREKRDNRRYRPVQYRLFVHTFYCVRFHARHIATSVPRHLSGAARFLSPPRCPLRSLFVIPIWY